MSEKWLLVDDDATFAATLSRALKRRGFDVVEANTAKGAVALAAKQQPQKIILDLKLAEASGLHLLSEFRQRLPHCQVVILTGYSSVTTAVEAIKLGAVNYLCKPATVAEILAAFELPQGDPDTSIADTPLSVDRLEWEHIQKVLAENNHNISETARQLGMHRRTLQRKLQKRPVRN